MQTKAALDYEVKNSYTVTVKAADPSLDSDTIIVTITVTDVNEPPEFDDGDSTDPHESPKPQRRARTSALRLRPQTRSATRSPIHWAGRMQASFTIVEAAQVKCKVGVGTTLDEETRDTYTVTVSVRDSEECQWSDADTATDDTITVTITVAGAKRTAGYITWSREERLEGTPITYPENSRETVATHSHHDPENDPVTWLLSGTDRRRLFHQQRRGPDFQVVSGL